MKLTWITDIHLNFLELETREKFYNKIIATHADAVLISGDIAEAPSIAVTLKEMASYIKKPIYFVLGNHDYYRGNISQVRNMMETLIREEKLLNWLPASGPHVLPNDAILLGQDGWADGRYGDYANSQVSLYDSRLIGDLFQQKMLGKYPLLEKMQQLADHDAGQLNLQLEQAISQYQPKKMIILSHVPPFKETCLYEGKISDDEYLPFFGSKASGDVLSRIAEKNPVIEFLVLCGHPHSEATYQPLHNLTVKVGKAEYYQPEIQEVIQI